MSTAQPKRSSMARPPRYFPCSTNESFSRVMATPFSSDVTDFVLRQREGVILGVR